MGLPRLSVEDLALARRSDGARLLHGVSFTVADGEILGIVGESGSGKSLLMRAIAGMLPEGIVLAGGRVRLDGEDLAGLSGPAWRRLRGPGIAMVFQDPFASLNPLRRLGDVIAEAVRAHHVLPWPAARARAVAALDAVGLAQPAVLARRFPHELSGGQRQRALIALARVNDPRVLIADEPTTALDPTARLGVLDCLAAGAAARATLVVTHDLFAAARICTRIGVMYGGLLVELGPLKDLFSAPAHPYLRALLDAQPRIGAVDPPAPIPGAAPSAAEPSPGCRFAPRCLRAQVVCRDVAPLLSAHAGRAAACHHPIEAGP